MKRKNYLLILIILVSFILSLLTACKYFDKIELSQLNNLRLKLININERIKSFFIKIERKFLQIFKILKLVIINNKTSSDRNAKISELNDFGKKYDELILNLALLYASNGIPYDKNIIISVYTHGGNIPDLSKFKKYHFKILDINKDEYDKLVNSKMNEINQSIIIESKSKIEYFYIKKYKLTIKNSKPALLCQLIDRVNNKYYALLENLPADVYNIPDDYKFYFKKSYPKIKFHTFYYYPLSCSLQEVVIGFYLPISRIRVFAFFAIIFLIAIVLLSLGFYLCKQYLFGFEKNINNNIKKMEKYSNMNNNINENRGKEERAKNTDDKKIGKEVDISEIPDFDDNDL